MGGIRSTHGFVSGLLPCA